MVEGRLNKAHLISGNCISNGLQLNLITIK